MTSATLHRFSSAQPHDTPRLRGVVLALTQAGLLATLGGLALLPRAGQAADRRTSPLFFEADQLEGESGATTRASGKVRLLQGDLQLRADSVLHEAGTNTATAVGNVRVRTGGNLFWGPSLKLQLDTEVGEFTSPQFWLTRVKAGGRAERVEFLGNNRLQAYWTTYSSCTPANTADSDAQDPGEFGWALKTSQVYMDLDASEGKAKDAVIWFKGVPILAAPTLTFPLDDHRKSGLLPPTFDYDSKSGFELSAPYYWNIAANRDMTLAPKLSTRRGAGLDLEFRYLEARDQGTWRLDALPDDRVAMKPRGLLAAEHQGFAQSAAGGDSRTDYDVLLRRVSDDDYWRDFPHNLPSLTPRLYDSHARFEHTLNASNWGLGDSQTVMYGNVQSWQTLRDRVDTTTESQITSPYRRTPQLGVRNTSADTGGLQWSTGAEFNRFTNADTTQVSGNRLVVQGQLSRPYQTHGFTITPKVSMRSTSYDLDSAMSNGSRSASRSIPSFSLDSTTAFDRQVHWFGRDLTQTLEPRLQYVRTAYRDQSTLPLFDTAPRDFNQYAIYNENAYTGGDRVNDANQLTMGVTSRLLDQKSGAEAMRLGVVQKVLLADQRINPNGTEPITQRLSDLLLLASTNAIPNWFVDTSAQLQGQSHAMQQGLLSLRFSPTAYRTVNLNYRYTRDASEQLELGWQWPLFGAPARSDRPSAQVNDVQATRDLATADPMGLSGQRKGNSGDCSGTWYAVGRLSYSLRDKLMSGSIVGFEYDAGCWIGRIVTDRVATSRTQASTRIMFQLELVGLSRLNLGSNPLKSLRDNIPGYKLLNDRSQPASTSGESSPLIEDE